MSNSPYSRHVLRDSVVQLPKSQEFGSIILGMKITVTNTRCRLRVSCEVTYIYVVWFFFLLETERQWHKKWRMSTHAYIDLMHILKELLQYSLFYIFVQIVCTTSIWGMGNCHVSVGTCPTSLEHLQNYHNARFVLFFYQYKIIV